MKSNKIGKDQMDKIIVIAGTVGAGKSTMLNAIYRYFITKGIKVYKTYLKTYHLFSFIIIYFLAKFLSKRETYPNPFAYIREEHPTLRYKLYGTLLFFAFFETLVLNLIKVLVPVLLGYMVIVEEHIFGYLTDHLHYALTNPKFFHKYGSKIIGLYLRIASSWPLRIIFLDAPNEILKERWSLRRSAFEVESYLNVQRRAINILAKLGFKVFFIRTDSPIIETFAEIVKILCS